MLDKLLLNNQILANKTVVRKVQVNLINKQVKKIRKLKNLEEKYPESKKFGGKVLKSTEVLNCLKKSKSGVVLRNALLSEDNPKKILTNGLSTPEEIAQALYAADNTIQSIVSNLKSILNINNADKAWRDELAEPSKRKRKQLRTEKKQMIRQERKARKELDAKRSEWLVENLPEVVIAGKNVSDVEENANDTNKVRNCGFDEEKIESDTKIKVIKRKETRTMKATSRAKVSKDPASESENEEESSVVDRTVDEFFVTQSGDHYLSTVVIDRTQPERPDDGLVRKDRRNMQSSNQKYPNNKRNFTNDSRNGWKSKEIDSGSSKGLITFERKAFPAKKICKGEQIVKPAEDLHPSWAAKQKQKGIKSFQGTKVVFNEESTAELKKASSGRSASKEKLHPSWEAKQKLKPTITEFKGKKVVFDDE